MGGIHPVIAPADPVEALAKVLKSVRVDGMPIVITWSDAEDLARAALAHARGLVPEVEELAQVMSGCDPDKWPAFINHYDAWSESYRRTARRVRAETLRRLGGEGGP